MVLDRPVHPDGGAGRNGHLCLSGADLHDSAHRRGVAERLQSTGNNRRPGTGILTTVAIPVAMVDAPLFASRLLSSRAILFVFLAVIFGISTEILLLRCRFLLAQIAAAGTVTFTLTGFAAAMYPDLLIGQLSLAAAAAPPATLRAFFAVLVIGIIILAPSLSSLLDVSRRTES